LILDSQVAFVTKWLGADFLLVNNALYHIWLSLYNYAQNIKNKDYAQILNDYV
jgi:hypothetical protein